MMRLTNLLSWMMVTVLIATLAGCGGLSARTTKILGILMDGNAFTNLQVDNVITLGVVAEGEQVSKSFKIVNLGTGPVEIQSIDWASQDGVVQKNQYVSLSFGPEFVDLEAGGSFTLERYGEIDFDVVFAPDYEEPDGTSSVLTIQTDGTDQQEQALPEARFVFTVPTDLISAAVTPQNFEFNSATPSSPGTQTFTVYNDCSSGTSGFTVTSVTLEQVSNEFTIVNQDPTPGTVKEIACGPSDPGAYRFDVRYLPSDVGNDSNTVAVNIAELANPIRIPVSSDVNLGSWSVSYNDENRLDFTNETSIATRSFILSSDGPGTLTVKTPQVLDSEAADSFSFTAWTPPYKDPESEACQSTPPATGCEDKQITSWPRGLQAFQVIRFDVTYTPSADAKNGQLVIPLSTPNVEEAVIDLFGGEPRGRIELAPATGTVSVTAAAADRGNACDMTDIPCSKPDLCVAGACSADTGNRQVIIYNHGNGPLQIVDLLVKAAFGPAELFSLVNPPSLSDPIAPNGYLALDVAWDTTNLVDLEGESETLEIQYVEPYTGETTSAIMGLYILDDGGAVKPTASIEMDTTEHVVDEPVVLQGSESYGGAFVLKSADYVWYLTAKPEGSFAKLNTEGGIIQTFTPDLPGVYEVELIVIPKEGTQFLVSEPASITVNVGVTGS